MQALHTAAADAVPGAGERRLSIPFFFNATSDYKQAVVPSKVSEKCPAKYPPTSYLDGQGVVQGE